MGASLSAKKHHGAGFTLLELLVVIGIIAVLAGLTMSGFKAYQGLATRAHCSSNLRQLCVATNLYLSDHNNFFPPYVENTPNGGRRWFFGNETSPPGTAEGNRELDKQGGPLYPYIEEVGKIEVCKGFNYGNALWKPKFKGASYGYGYNWLLGGRMTGLPLNSSAINGATTILFGDCAQANGFQKPATPKKPMIEEFYIINETDKTIHFRHSQRANMLFVDGHVEVFAPAKGTEDRRIKGELLGRITPVGSMKFLR